MDVPPFDAAGQQNWRRNKAASKGNLMNKSVMIIENSYSFIGRAGFFDLKDFILE